MRPASGPGRRLDGVGDAILEEGPVREPGQAVVEGLVAELLVEAGVLEGHARLGRERLGEADPAVVEELGSREVTSIAPRARPLASKRQGGHRPLPDRVDVVDLGRVGRRVRVVDDHRPLALEDAPRRGVVSQRVPLVDGGAPLRRVVAVGQDAVAGLVPVADPALVGADRLGDVAGRQVADLARVERLRELGRQLDDVGQLVGRRAQSPCELADEERDQPEHRGDRGDVEGGHDSPRDRGSPRAAGGRPADERRDRQREPRRARPAPGARRRAARSRPGAGSPQRSRRAGGVRPRGSAGTSRGRAGRPARRSGPVPMRGRHQPTVQAREEPSGRPPRRGPPGRG